MSCVSANRPGNIGLSASGNQAVGIPTPEKPPGELPVYKPAPKKREAEGECRDPISANVRHQGWMCPALSAYSNSGYAYATIQIALALLWGKGGGETCLSKPLYVSFAIPSHCLNTTDANNYSVRTHAKWSCGDTITKESAATANLGDFGKYPNC